jgi:hypothetical protein
MKWTDFFNIALFAFLWFALIMKKANIKDWLLEVTNDHLVIAIIVPVVIYAGMIILVRIIKNKYLNE